MLKYLAAADFKVEAKLGTAAGNGLRLTSVALRQVNEKDRAATFVFSDGAVDRAGDRLDPYGWELGDFRRNPVAQYGHQQRELPIGRARNVRVQGGQLIGEIQFAPPETSSFADQVYRMVRDGYLNAVSVGFLPLEWTWARDPGRPMGIDFRRQALLEISVVNVPAHQGALLVGASADKAKARAKRQRELDLLVLRHGP